MVFAPTRLPRSGGTRAVCAQSRIPPPQYRLQRSLGATQSPKSPCPLAGELCVCAYLTLLPSERCRYVLLPVPPPLPHLACLPWSGRPDRHGKQELPAAPFLKNKTVPAFWPCAKESDLFSVFLTWVCVPVCVHCRSQGCGTFWAHGVNFPECKILPWVRGACEMSWVALALGPPRRLRGLGHGVFRRPPFQEERWAKSEVMVAFTVLMVIEVASSRDRVIMSSRNCDPFPATMALGDIVWLGSFGSWSQLVAGGQGWLVM